MKQLEDEIEALLKVCSSSCCGCITSFSCYGSRCISCGCSSNSSSSSSHQTFLAEKC